MDTLKTGFQLRRGDKYNYIIYICVLLACLVPRYISTFKLHLGINFSMYTIVTVIASLSVLRRLKIVRKLEFYYIWIWAAFIVFSIWRAEKLGVWGYYLDWVLTSILFQQILCTFSNEKTYDFIIRALTDALCLHLLIGVYEITAHRYLFEIGNISGRLYGHVAVGIFHNLNDYATFVTTMIPFAIYRFMVSNSKIAKFYSALLATISLYMIVISESRGAMLTLIVFAIVGLIIFARKSRRNTLVVAAGISAFIIIYLTNWGGVQSSVHNLISTNTIDITNNSDIARINLIKNGLYFLRLTYGFGVGAGNLYKWLGEKSIYYIGELRFIHNWYAEVLVTFGVFFFIIYLLFHGKVMYKLASKNYGTSSLKKTFFLSFVCFSIVSISSSSNVYSEWVWMYLVVVSYYTLITKNR